MVLLEMTPHSSMRVVTPVIAKLVPIAIETIPDMSMIILDSKSRRSSYEVELMATSQMLNSLTKALEICLVFHACVRVSMMGSFEKLHFDLYQDS